MDPEHIRDVFSGFEPVSVRRLFGGAGVYADGVMFALVIDEVIYLKADARNMADFDRENLAPFTYATRKERRAVMSYRRMPDRLYDDPAELALWARRALDAAHRSGAGKKRSIRAAGRKQGKAEKGRRRG